MCWCASPRSPTKSTPSSAVVPTPSADGGGWKLLWWLEVVVVVLKGESVFFLNGGREDCFF